MLLNLLISIFVLSVLILVHEFGHFIFARLFKVKVFEFSIGFGFKLYQKQVNDTLYSIRALPFGGYVRLAGVDKSISADKYLASESFNNITYWKKVVILAAGSFANILLGFCLLFMVSFVAGTPEGVSRTIDKVYVGTPAELAGLQSGDTILALDERSVDGVTIIKTIRLSEGNVLKLQIKRNDEILEIVLTPALNKKSKSYYAGFKLSPIEIKRLTFLESLKKSCIELFSYIVLILSAFGGLLFGKVSFSEISGPLGIVRLTGEMVNYGLLYLMRFIVILNINLAILNLFPIPALDGGRILVLTFEKLIRRTLKEETIERIHYLGGLVLMSVLVYITYMDIKKIIIK